MVWIAVLAASLSAIFCALMAAVNYSLLFSIFRSKVIKKSSSLTLFYSRFLIDGIIGTICVPLEIFMLMKLVFPQVNMSHYRTPVFAILSTSVNLTNMRSLVVMIVSLQRVVAVCWPIFYRNARRKLSNFVLLTIVFLSPIGNSVLFFETCGNSLNFPLECVVFACLTNQCYKSFLSIFGLVSKILTTSFTIVFALKLLVLRKSDSWKNMQNTDRANQLALVGAAIIVIFDVLPTTVYANIGSGQFEDYGAWLFCFKMGGFVLEGIIVRWTFMKKSKYTTGSSRKKTRNISVLKVASDQNDFKVETVPKPGIG